MKRSGKKRRYDETMAAVVLILLAAGPGDPLQHQRLQRKGEVHDEWYYLKKQGFAVAVGLLGMVLASRIDYHRLAVLAVPGYAASLALSAAVLFFGDEYNGSKRWAVFGPFFFSAVRVCQGGGDPLPGMAYQQVLWANG